MEEKMCKMCLNCRTKNHVVFCSIGHFVDKTIEAIDLYVPEDFNCEEFESDDDELTN